MGVWPESATGTQQKRSAKDTRETGFSNGFSRNTPGNGRAQTPYKRTPKTIFHALQRETLNASKLLPALKTHDPQLDTRHRICDTRSCCQSGSGQMQCPCRSGGIGRRAWFRSMYSQGCGGSSPLFGTKKAAGFQMPRSGVECVSIRTGLCCVWTLTATRPIPMKLY